MALITTPGQLKQQGEFYLQLSSMTRAGVTIVHAVETLHRSPPNRRLGAVAGRIGEIVQQGSTFTEAMRSARAHLPEFDIALLEAGETSGRLTECLRLLGDFYQERARLVTQVISAMIYPALLLTFAILIFPTTLLSDLVWFGRVDKYVFAKLQIALPIAAIVFVCIWALQAKRGRRWRNFLERAFGMIPMVAGTQRDLALARLCAALESLINAGVTIIEAWDIAARATGSQKFERAVAAAKPRLLQGETPGEVISQQRAYPDLFTSMYRTGEVSGQLDETLRRLYQHYMESATTSMQRLAIIVPKIAYLGVALAIAYQILSFYSNYFNQLNEIMK
jgi:type II secretory pathway component PulF